MKKSKDEIRLCKNKKCHRSLPEEYKHRYCEACRNKQAEGWKNAGKGLLGVAGTALSVVVLVANKGKSNTKE